MHGSNGAYLHWLRNIKALARLRTVLTPDLPGFGDSLDIAPDISLEGYVDLQTRAINEMCGEAEPIDIVGFSFGGQIAAGCAVQLGNRVQTLSLLTPSGFEKPTGRFIGVPRRETFPPTPGGQHNFHREVLLKVMFANPDSVDTEAIEIERHNIEHTRFNGQHISWSGRLLSFVKKVKGRVQLIYGDADRIAFPSSAERIALCREARPDIKATLIPSAGHWVQYEQGAGGSIACWQISSVPRLS
jgi:2-hydroxy-6-oxonona-2,4-dienedioate hydrolase